MFGLVPISAQVNQNLVTSNIGPHLLVPKFGLIVFYFDTLVHSGLTKSWSLNLVATILVVQEVANLLEKCQLSNVDRSWLQLN